MAPYKAWIGGDVPAVGYRGGTTRVTALHSTGPEEFFMYPESEITNSYNTQTSGYWNGNLWTANSDITVNCFRVNSYNGNLSTLYSRFSAGLFELEFNGTDWVPDVDTFQYVDETTSRLDYIGSFESTPLTLMLGQEVTIPQGTTFFVGFSSWRSTGMALSIINGFRLTSEIAIDSKLEHLGGAVGNLGSRLSVDGVGPSNLETDRVYMNARVAYIL